MGRHCWCINFRLTGVYLFRSISSWKWCVRIQLLFESQVSVLQLKKLFSFLIFSEVTARESQPSIPLCNRCIAGRRGSDEIFCCFRYLSNS